MATDGTKGNAKVMTNEQIINNFQALRKEQLRIGNKVSELELELHEHKIVIDTLKEVDGDRKCFRMVGGLLCERTVKEVLPILVSNQEQLATCIKDLTETLNKKSQELNDFTEKHNLKIRGQDDASSQNDDGDKKPRTGNVLVVNPM